MLCLKQHLSCQCIQKSSFLEQIVGNSREILPFETWADLDPEPETLCEHGARKAGEACSSFVVACYYPNRFEAILKSRTRDNITLFCSVGRFSFPKKFWRKGGHRISLKKQRRMSASRGHWSKKWLTVSTDQQLHIGELTTDLRWRSTLIELHPSLNLVCRML